MNVSYLITFTTKQLRNYYMHALCSLKSCSEVSTKRDRQLIVILDTFGCLFSDLSVCQKSTVCLQTIQNIQRNFVLEILHVLPTPPRNFRHYNPIEDPIYTLVDTGA